MRLIFGIGTGQKGKAWHNAPILPYETEGSISQAIGYFTHLYGGCFIQRGEGAWKDDSGKIVREQGITITVEVKAEDYPPGRLQRDSHELCQMFEQDCIVATCLESTTLFLS